MDHDEHFLTRLERLDRGHAEIALGLYYDSALVQHILHVADIPDDTDRVALCLGTPEDGPFLIVARDGHFVTCLGEGMQLQEGQSIISRHRLDTISESVESLRSLFADADAGGRSQTERALARAFTAGSGLNQQEFEDAARWLPLLAIDFLRSHMDTVERCHRIAEHLARYKKIKRRHEELLHDYWRSTWKIAHLTMLLASDSGATARRLIEALEPEFPGSSMQLPWSLIRLGVTSFAVRGAWVASKMPSLVVPTAKRRYVGNEITFLNSLTDGLSLAAVGLRHRRYQAEVRKTLAKVDVPLTQTSDYPDIIHHLCAVYFEQHTTAPEVYLDHTIDISRKFLRALYEHLDQAHIDALDDVPANVAVALFLTLPLGFHGDADAIRSLFERLPWIVTVEAKDFYLPAPYDVFVQAPWTPEDGLALLEARKEGGIFRPKPVVRGPKIGRNAACPCGSGKKYKRCCGAPGKH